MLPESAIFPVPPEISPAQEVCRLYSALIRTLALDFESGLGGKLIFAGEIGSADAHDSTRGLLYAANIAGAASLVAVRDLATQRQAIRDGVVDFLVTSLEEALRILKNEVRKRQAVSVAVSIAAEQLVHEMLERGVLPDLLPPANWLDSATGASKSQGEQFRRMGATSILLLEGQQEHFVTWSVDREFPRWLPRLDNCAHASIPPEDLGRHRWLRLAPRYLGRIAQHRHGAFLGPTEVELMETKAHELLRQHSAEGYSQVKIEIAGRTIS